MTKSVFHIGFVVLLGFALASCAGKSQLTSARTSVSAVGIRTFAFVDAARGRELITRVWYPTDAIPGPVVPPEGIFDPSAVANAAWHSTPEKLPLILLSHGSGGYAETLAWLASHLASRGFIVAAPNHPGDTFGNISPEGVYKKWERPRDVSFLLSEIVKHEELGRRVDPARVGAAGFSMGGYTGLALAGAKFHGDAFDRYCATKRAAEDCQLFKGVNRKKVTPDNENLALVDSRIRAVFALSPFGGPGMKGSELAAVAVPTFIVGVKDDLVLPFDLNAEAVARQISSSKLETIAAGGHFVLTGPCTEKGKNFVKELCGDKAGVDRAKIHQDLREKAVGFFSENLGAG